MSTSITQPQNAAKCNAEQKSDSAIVPDLNGLLKQHAPALADGLSRDPWPEPKPKLPPSPKPKLVDDVEDLLGVEVSFVDRPEPQGTPPRPEKRKGPGGKHRRKPRYRDLRKAAIDMEYQNANVEKGEPGFQWKRLNRGAVGLALYMMWPGSECRKYLARLPKRTARAVLRAAQGQCEDGSPRLDIMNPRHTRARAIVALHALLWYSGEIPNGKGTRHVSGVSQKCIAALLGCSLSTLNRSGSDGTFRRFKGFKTGKRASERGLEADGWKDGSVGYLPALGQTGALDYWQPPSSGLPAWAKGPVHDDGRSYAYCVYWLSGDVRYDVLATLEDVRDPAWTTWNPDPDTPESGRAPPN